LQDPVLELHDGTGALLTSNDDWKVSQQAAIEATGLAPPDDREPAILLNLQPGSYTAIESGKNGTTGVGLIDVYDVDVLSASHLSNISTRGLVQTGNNVMIGGFIVSGASGSINLVVRALGPTLASFGVANALHDPTLQLNDSNGTVIRFDNNWKDSQQTQIQNSGRKPRNDLEPAIARAQRHCFLPVRKSSDGSSDLPSFNTIRDFLSHFGIRPALRAPIYHAYLLSREFTF
jgi:hypothetical protein